MDALPTVKLVRVEVDSTVAFWAPLVGLKMEREPLVEDFLRHLAVVRGRTEQTTRNYAAWLKPAIQFKVASGLTWDEFPDSLDQFLIWRRKQRRESKGRGQYGPSRVTLNLMMVAITQLYKYSIDAQAVSASTIPTLFEETDAPAIPAHLLEDRYYYESVTRLRPKHKINSGAPEADRRLAMSRQKPKAITDAEMAKLVANARSVRDAFIFVLMRYVGLRVGQVATLNRTSIHQAGTPCEWEGLGSHIHIDPPVGHPHHDGVKRGDYFAVPMGREAVEMWWAWLDERSSIKGAATSPWLFLCFDGPSGREGSPISADAIRSMLSATCRRAGISDISPHRLRHGLGQEAADNDIPPDVLQIMLGQRSIHSQAPYRKASHGAAAEAVVQLDMKRRGVRA